MSDELDLSGYKVEILHGMLGYSWKARTPDGEAVPSYWFKAVFVDKLACERDALRCITRHAKGPDEVDGNALRDRVRGSAPVPS